MSKANVAPQQHGSLLWGLYVVTWVGLAGIAICYLSVAASRTDFYAAVSGSALSHAKKTELEQKNRIAAELINLRDDVKNLKLKLDMAQARSAATLKPQAKDNSAVAASISSNEVPSQSDLTVASTPSPQTHRQAKAPARLQTSSQNIDETEIPPLPDRLVLAARDKNVGSRDRVPMAAIVLNAKQTSPVVTGGSADNGQEKPAVSEFDKPVVMFGAPTIVAEVPFPKQSPAHAFAVVVAVAASLNDLRANWRRLSAFHPDSIGKLQARYDRMGPPEAKYRLLTGPLSDHAQADELCGRLEMRNVNCSVGEFIGKLL